jgi:mono/diheme cytochrome c family protein
MEGEFAIMLRIVLGFLAGLVLVPLVFLCWFASTSLPAAVADKPLPMEQRITFRPLLQRALKEAPKKAPFDPDEENLTSGAQVYRDECAVCHGFHGKPARLAPHLYPSPLQLWEKHPGASGPIVGLSDDPAGVTYWKIANGMRLSAMPAYKGVLTDSQLWEVSLLLANSDKPLPPLAVDILRGNGPPPTPPSAAMDPSNPSSGQENNPDAKPHARR